MNTLPAPFTVWRDAIASALEQALGARRTAFREVHRLGPDAAERLEAFSVSGKLIRGALVCLGSALTSGRASNDAVTAGAAMELFQSALLVHDDIMDRDEVRRGADSIYHQYAGMAQSDGIGDALHTGESLGICSGDIAFFVAFELLSRLDAPPGIRNRVIELCSRELQYVGIAQMADVYRGATGFDPEADGVSETNQTLKVYLYKTGRYTFSLPLMMGAILSGSPEADIAALESIGERLGILFQIKDDEIGLFGSEEEVGKPVGSDVREGKKTVFYTELLTRLSAGDRERLATVFGNPDASGDDVAWFRSLCESTGTNERVAHYAKRYAEEANGLIAGLEAVDPEGRAILEALLIYNLERTR